MEKGEKVPDVRYWGDVEQGEQMQPSNEFECR